MSFKNEYDWQGELDLTQSNKVILPDEPLEFQIARFAHYINGSNKEITFSYSVRLGSEPFEVRSMESGFLHYQIDDNPILKWTDTEFGGHIKFDSSYIKKGKHQLNVALEFKDKIWETSEEIDINSPYPIFSRNSGYW